MCVYRIFIHVFLQKHESVTLCGVTSFNAMERQAPCGAETKMYFKFDIKKKPIDCISIVYVRSVKC